MLGKVAVGGLSLALFVVLVAAAITLSLPLVRASLVAVIVSLVLGPIVAVALLLMTRSTTRAPVEA